MNNQDHLNEIYLENATCSFVPVWQATPRIYLTRSTSNPFLTLQKPAIMHSKFFFSCKTNLRLSVSWWTILTLAAMQKELARFAKRVTCHPSGLPCGTIAALTVTRNLFLLSKKQYENDLKMGTSQPVTWPSWSHVPTVWCIKKICGSNISAPEQPITLFTWTGSDSTADLVSWLSENGDSQRAYKIPLTTFCKCQAYYPDRIRSTQMAQYMKRIFEQTQKTNDKARQKANLYLWGLTAAFTLSLVFPFIVAFSLVKLKRHRKNLAEVNKKLGDNIAQLSEAKEALVATTTKIEETNRNWHKQLHQGGIYRLWFYHLFRIYRQDAIIRQTINRKLMGGQTNRRGDPHAPKATSSIGKWRNSTESSTPSSSPSIRLRQRLQRTAAPWGTISPRQDEDWTPTFRIFALRMARHRQQRKDSKPASSLHANRLQRPHEDAQQGNERSWEFPADRVKPSDAGKLGRLVIIYTTMKHPLINLSIVRVAGAKAFVERNAKAKRMSTMRICLLISILRLQSPALSVTIATGLLCPSRTRSRKRYARHARRFRRYVWKWEKSGSTWSHGRNRSELQSVEYLFSVPNIYPYKGFEVHTLDLFFECHVEDITKAVAQDDAAEICISNSKSWTLISSDCQESVKKAITLYKEFRKEEKLDELEDEAD